MGETINFAKRQREHLINILGLNYRIIDADSAVKGVEKILWNGMWREKANRVTGNAISIYPQINSSVIKYLKIIDVYFAPTKFKSNIRKHIEGSIGWNLRNNHPNFCIFYPDDCHLGTMPNKLNETIMIDSKERILGLDKEISV